MIKEFVQVFHPHLECIWETSDCIKDKVAEYYFSSGEIRPICLFHLEESGCMGHNGHYMSKEYYDQVYQCRVPIKKYMSIELIEKNIAMIESFIADNKSAPTTLPGYMRRTIELEYVEELIKLQEMKKKIDESGGR